MCHIFYRALFASRLQEAPATRRSTGSCKRCGRSRATSFVINRKTTCYKPFVTNFTNLSRQIFARNGYERIRTDTTPG